MDVASIATAMMSAQAGRTQLAVAAKMLKMNLDSQASVVKLLTAGQQNIGDAAFGLGQNLDISV